MSRRPTLADVGELAGVSAKSVSNVLLGRAEVSGATRAAVLAAVDTLGYEVNGAGRGLVSGRSHRVAVVVPNLFQPYFAEVAERLIRMFGERGYATTLRVAHGDDAEREAVLGASALEVDGVVVCAHGFGDAMVREQPPRRPVVQLGGAPSSEVDCVVMAEREGSALVTRHLLAQGRRRIAVVWNDMSGGHPRGDRFDGYLDELAKDGIEPDDALFVSGSDWDRRASGYEAMLGLLRSGAPFDAALCVNDATAVGAMAALRAEGVRVPQDVAVAGFDDTDESGFTVPSLTSVYPEQERMVEAAVSMLMERIEGSDAPPRQAHTGATLVVRESTSSVAG